MMIEIDLMKIIFSEVIHFRCLFGYSSLRALVGSRALDLAVTGSVIDQVTYLIHLMTV